MANDSTPFPWRRFLAPRYWPLWIAMALMRGVILLPFKAQIAIGAMVGHISSQFLAKHREIAYINIGICFPELDEDSRQRLMKDHFASLGIGLVEAANCWWASEAKLRRMVTICGLENLERAKSAGQPVILLSAHFTTLEIGGRLLGLFTPFHLMYRPSGNPLIEEVVRRNRQRHFGKVIPRNSVKEMIKSLKEGVPVWYAPDQNYRHKNSAIVPFFGVPAATNTATSRIARTTGAIVIPYLVHRLPSGEGYRLTLGAPLEGFPSDDLEADARIVNDILETAVRESPEQYLWIHRRFKPMPGQVNPYTRP